MECMARPPGLEPGTFGFVVRLGFVSKRYEVLGKSTSYRVFRQLEKPKNWEAFGIGVGDISETPG